MKWMQGKGGGKLSATSELHSVRKPGSSLVQDSDGLREQAQV